MARRTGGNVVRLLDWAPDRAPEGSTRSAAAMARAWTALTSKAEVAGQPMPLVLVGSAPTALEQLLDQLEAGAPVPSLVIGMPVGFVGVPESKRRLASTDLAQIRLEGTRGGAGLVGAACNALLLRQRRTEWPGTQRCRGRQRVLRPPSDPVPVVPVAPP